MFPSTVTDLQAIVKECQKLSLRSGGSKTALSRPRPGAVEVDLARLSGMLEYQPEEYTFTALSGTPVSEVEQILAGNGQYLPFDPVLVEAGATLGGTVASGLSGAGRYRYGGVRDFLLGVKFVDGQGRLVRSGGRVVKNAAGFDLPKLMVGSLGQYGALVELSFKVFPRPEAFITVQAGFSSLSEALGALIRLTGEPLDIFALDLIPTVGDVSLYVRLAGAPHLFPSRVERVRRVIGPGSSQEGESEAELWRSAREFSWAGGVGLFVKVPTIPAVVPLLDAGLPPGVSRRYSAGGTLAWLAWPGSESDLEELLSRLGLSGLVVLGEAQRVRLGSLSGGAFAHRVKAALDPSGLWAEV
jgi:glycolate oxidase FAD binding subunit